MIEPYIKVRYDHRYTVLLANIFIPYLLLYLITYPSCLVLLAILYLMLWLYYLSNMRHFITYSSHYLLYVHYYFSCLYYLIVDIIAKPKSISINSFIIDDGQ